MLKWKDCPYSKALLFFSVYLGKALQIISGGVKIKDYVDSFGAPTNKGSGKMGNVCLDPMGYRGTLRYESADSSFSSCFVMSLPCESSYKAIGELVVEDASKVLFT